MNFKYLKIVKKSSVSEKEGYLIKPVDFVVGYSDEYGNNYLRDYSNFIIAFPKEIDGYTYNDYLEDFYELLDFLGHVCSEHIVLALTHIFVTLRDKSISTEKAWGDFKTKMFTKCRMHLEFPTKIYAGPSLETIHLKNYDIGRFDVTTIKTKIKNNTISDYWDRYIHQKPDNESIFSNNLSFRRLEENIVIINLSKLWFSKYYQNISDKYIFDLYFNALTEQWFKLFWKDLDDQLIESAAMGGAYYSPKLFQELSGVEGIQIGVYTYIDNNDRNGWVTPFTNKILEINFDSQLKIPLLNGKLKTLYNKLSLPTSDYIQPVKILIHFIGNGTKLLQEDRIDEAFMNLWIALDTVLNNDTEAKSNQLKNRIAALSWYQYNSNQSDQYDLLNILYKRRSAYIHSGVPVSRDNALSLHAVSQTVLDVLLNVHAYSSQIKPISYSEWLSNIDKIIEISYKGEQVDKVLFESTGIIS